MFIKILKLINTICTSNIYHEPGTLISSMERKMLLLQRNLLEVKAILNEMSDSRNAELKLFTETFQIIVEDHKIGKNNVIKWPLPSSHESHEFSGILISDSDSTLQDKVFILNKLFFNDLLFYYYNFWHRMNVKFSEKVNTCVTNLERIRRIFTDVQKVKNFSTDELGLGAFFNQVTKIFTLYDFFKELESIVCKYLGVNGCQIYKWLRFEVKSEFFCDIEKGCKIYNFIQHYLRKYISSMSEVEKNCLQFHNTTFFSRSDSFHDFEDNFLDCITLDITGEFEKSLQLPEDDERFRTYKKYENVINECVVCKRYCKNMLKNVRCVDHQYILDSIRAEYFKFVDNFTFSNSILSNADIFQQLYSLLR